MGSDNFTVSSTMPVGPIDGASWSGERKRKGDERPPKPRPFVEDSEVEETEGDSPEASEHLDLLA
jgi:hypothetical protein